MGPVIFGFQKWLRVACFCSWWWHRLGFQIWSAHRCTGRWASWVTNSEREIGQGREEVQLTRSTNSAARDLKNKCFKIALHHHCTPKVISPHLPGIWFPNIKGDTRVILEWPRWGVEEVRLAGKSLMSSWGRVCSFSLLIFSSGGRTEESTLGVESGPWVGLWPWPGSRLQVTFWIEGGWSHHPAPRGWQEGKMKACVEVPATHWAHLGLDERDGLLAGSWILFLRHFIITITTASYAHGCGLSLTSNRQEGAQLLCSPEGWPGTVIQSIKQGRSDSRAHMYTLGRKALSLSLSQWALYRPKTCLSEALVKA